MDETQALLRALMGRFDEMNAELKGVRTEVKELRSEVAEFRKEATEHLEKIEERVDHLVIKWMEHDEEIRRLRRREA